MGLKPVVLLGLLPHPIVAGVTCSYSSAAQKGDTCQSFADSWDLSVDDIKSLNPGLECPDFASSDGPATTSKPARLTTTSHAPVKPKTTTLQKPPAPTDTGDIPSPVQTGLVSSCDKYHLVSSGDQCAAIEKTYGITSDEFNEWNPAVNDTE
ncbi:hypothetical protein KEM56_002196 [Ascosphaera pollenicola]|nr:hypothetical protein KEM56_002196 [Ascosphaera pollenicola]